MPQNRFFRPPGRRYRRSGGWSTPASEGHRPAATSTPHLLSRSESEIDIQHSTLRWASSPPLVQFCPNALCRRHGRRRGGLGGPWGDGTTTTLVVGPGCNPRLESRSSRRWRRGCSSPGSSAAWRSSTASSKGQRTRCVCYSMRRLSSIARHLPPGGTTALQAVVPPPSSRNATAASPPPPWTDRHRRRRL